MGSGCYVGAIRWDAWYAQRGPALSTRRSLGPNQYQFRAPFFTKILSEHAIQFAPDDSSMSREIDVAVNAGLSYWAFLLYDRNLIDADMMAGYDLFQQNSNRNRIKWCQIRSTDLWGSTGNFSTQVSEAVAMCQQSNYMTVLNGRPLVYIYGGTASSSFGGSDANFKAAIDSFRAGCLGAGLGNPYIVIMGGAAASSHAARIAWGCDAISNYISNFVYNAVPSLYSKLDSDAQAFWAQMAATGSKVVPIAMCGWDKVPRIDKPVAWNLAAQKPYQGSAVKFNQPTNAELTAHFASAVSYVNANPTVCDSKAIIAYAWNEFDEGGWLCPTLGDPEGSRLKAIASAIAF